MWCRQSAWLMCLLEARMWARTAEFDSSQKAFDDDFKIKEASEWNQWKLYHRSRKGWNQGGVVTDNSENINNGGQQSATDTRIFRSRANGRGRSVSKFSILITQRNVLCFHQECRTRQDKLRFYCSYYFGGFHGSLRRHSKYASAEISFVGLSLRWCLGRAMGKYTVFTTNYTISSFLNSLINNQEKTKVLEHWNIGILISI